MPKADMTEARLKAAELLANGETQTIVAKMVNVNVKTIQRWLKDVEFKADVAKNVQLLKSKVENKIIMNIEPIMNRLLDIALRSESEKTTLDACIYAINRIAGTPTNKTQDISNESDKEVEVNIDDMLKEIDNVIDISQVK